MQSNYFNCVVREVAGKLRSARDLSQTYDVFLLVVVKEIQMKNIGKVVPLHPHETIERNEDTAPPIFKAGIKCRLVYTFGPHGFNPG
jgi:hypothetical protein